MDKNEIVFLVIMVAVLGFRLYKKYFKKSQVNKSDKEVKSSSSKDDDYEPYRK